MNSISAYLTGWRDCNRAMKWLGGDDRINDAMTPRQAISIRPSVAESVGAYLNGWHDAILRDTYRYDIVSKQA